MLGLGLALGAIQVLKAIGPADLPRFSTLSIDANVFLFAAACVLLVAFLVGLAPALRVSRGDLSALINTGGRSAGTARGRNRIFGALVIAEIALAVVLVIGAGLLVRSYSQLASADPGFDPRRMVTLVLNVTGRIDVRNLRFDQERRPAFTTEPACWVWRSSTRSSCAASTRCRASLPRAQRLPRR